MDPYNSKDEEQISYKLRGKTSQVARSQRKRNQNSKVNAEKSIQRKPVVIIPRQSSLPYEAHTCKIFVGVNEPVTNAMSICLVVVLIECNINQSMLYHIVPFNSQ